MIDPAHPYGLEHVRKPHSGSEVRISAAASNSSDSMYHRIHLVLRRDAVAEILTSRFRKRVSGHALSIRSYYQPKKKMQSRNHQLYEILKYRKRKAFSHVMENLIGVFDKGIQRIISSYCDKGNRLFKNRNVLEILFPKVVNTPNGHLPRVFFFPCAERQEIGIVPAEKTCDKIACAPRVGPDSVPKFAFRDK